MQKLLKEDFNVHDSPFEIHEENKMLLDIIIEDYGYNISTFKVIFITCTILSLEGLHMTLFPNLIIPMREYYSLNSELIKMVSGILFIGVGLGSFLTGYFTKKFGRVIVIKMFISLLCISHLVLALYDNLFMLCLCRFIIGFALGIIVPISLSLLSEYLPIKYRAFVLTSVWASYNIGQLSLSIIMYNIMPNFETNKLRLTLIIALVLPIITLVVNLYMLEDSPRNLILKGDIYKAFEIIERYYQLPLTEHMKTRLVDETMQGNNKIYNSSIRDMFKGHLLKLSILETLIWFCSSIILYGPMLIYNLTLKSIGVVHKRSNIAIIKSQIVISIIYSFGNFIGGFLSEIPQIGRNRTNLIGLLFALFFMLLCIAFPTAFSVFFGFMLIGITMSFNINTTYTCEVYPTVVRDLSLGFLFSATRAGGFLSQIIYINVISYGIWVPYYLTCGFIIINMLLVRSLPFETYGKPLDVNFDNRNTKNLYIKIRT